MKSRDILLLAGVGLLAWWLLRDKKKPLMKEDLSAGKGGSDAPPFKGAQDKKAPNPYRLRKNPISVDDLSKKQPVFVTPKLDVMPDVLKPELKEPISIPAANLIPNVYDRGVNQPLPDQYYASFAGVCSEDIQSACKCTSTKSEKYQIDLPKLP